MATTGTEVFESAMALMDKLENGVADNSNTAEFKARTLPIINTLLNRLYQYSDTKTVTAGTRPVLAKVTSLASNLGIDDGLARSVLPYGLAAQLLVFDDPASANVFFQQFEENLNVFKNAPVASEDITDLYGGININSD